MSCPVIPDEDLIFEEPLIGGQMWSWIIKRGQCLRLRDTRGGANVAMLCYNARQPLERYNMADSLKAQHIARFTAGAVLMSDMGRVLLSIPHDEVGWHDPLGGCTHAEMIAERYGPTSYQEQRNQRYQNARDSFLIELGKHGLGKRDLVPNVNLFSRVVVEGSGRLRYEAASDPGAAVDLRAEMDTLVVLSNTPHPLAPGGTWDPPTVELSLWRSGPAGPDDACRLSCDENGRAYTLTERYVA